MSGGNVPEIKHKWNFGANAVSEGGSTANSTAAGAAQNCFGIGREHSFYIESSPDNSTCSYQIRSGRTSSGPWVVLSSGTLGTNSVDLVQITGPLAFVSPRLKTLQSTSGGVIVELFGN